MTIKILMNYVKFWLNEYELAYTQLDEHKAIFAIPLCGNQGLCIAAFTNSLHLLQPFSDSHGNLTRFDELITPVKTIDEFEVIFKKVIKQHQIDYQLKNMEIETHFNSLEDTKLYYYIKEKSSKYCNFNPYLDDDKVIMDILPPVTLIKYNLIDASEKIIYYRSNGKFKCTHGFDGNYSIQERFKQKLSHHLFEIIFDEVQNALDRRIKSYLEMTSGQILEIKELQDEAYG